MAIAFEEVVEELPEFLDAGQRAKAHIQQANDELAAWFESIPAWTARANDLANAVDEVWFLTPSSLRRQAYELFPVWLERAKGSLSMLDAYESSLARAIVGADLIVKYRGYLDQYIDAVQRLLDAMTAKLVTQQQRQESYLASNESKAKVQEDYEKGKREAEAGKVTLYTPEEFHQRFG